MKLLFWLSFSLLFYTYLGYPALIALLARIRARPVKQKRFHPTVSLVIAAHNEEGNIGRKLDNALALEYPRDRLEIVLASDGSNDRTVEIARGYEARGVKVVAFATRRGKPSVLNDVIPQCTGEIIVLGDARQRYDPKALLALVQNFHDPSVGAVSGELYLTNNLEVAVGEGVDFYWRYEKFIRRQESRLDSTVGATGAIYAIRRDLFEPIPPDTLLDDVLIPMRIARRGYRIVFEPGAKAFDLAAQTEREEFARKVRTITGNLQLFRREAWLWNVRANRLWFQALSHKVLRVLGPFMLGAMFLASASLAGSSPVYEFAWDAQFLFYAAAVGGHFLARAPGVGRWLSAPYAFCLLNLAALVAIFRFLTGKLSVTWTKASEVAGYSPEPADSMNTRSRREDEPMDQEAEALSPTQPPQYTALPLAQMHTPRADGHSRIGTALEQPDLKPMGWTWQSVLVFSVIACLVLWLFFPVFRHLVYQWWDDENYSHGFLIPLMSGYFIWQRRGQLARFPLSPSPLGLIVLAVGVGLLLLGTTAAELFTTRVSFLVVLTGLALSFLGPQHLRMLAFPIAYLFFMIPPPAIVFNAIAFPLQLFAARTATAGLQLLDIPVLREGNLITLANTSLEVAEACSGIRSLVTLLALATTLAYFTHRGLWRSGILVVSALPIAIIANASRVAGTGILAHFYGPQVAQGFFHTFSGWFLFLVAAMLLGMTGTLLAKLPGRHTQGQARVSSPGFPTQDQRLAIAEPRTLAGWGRMAGVTAILVAGIVSLATLSHGEAVPLRRPLERIPLSLGVWQGTGNSLPPPILSVLGVTDYMNRLYAGPGKAPIWLYVGYYETQRQGQIIHSPAQCLPGSGWNFLSREYLSLRLPGRPDPVTINNVLVGKGEEQQIVLYWYQERGRIIASEYAAKLYLVTDSIRRNRTDGALVRLSTPVRGSTQETLRELLEFTDLMFPSLAEFLPG
jgi:exosortase D (VPLPA-CTERM-specific)